jgi:hypothetical protein
MHHRRAYGLHIASELDLPGFGVADGAQAVPDVAIKFGHGPGGPADAGASWYQVASHALRFAIPGVGAYLIQDGNRITVAPEAGADPAEVRIFLLGSAMGALLLQRGLFPLHGSAVATPQGAMVFCGPSGIGKSTLAAHFQRRGYRLLSDDVCAVSPDGRGGLQVLPAFPHLRLCADAVDRLFDAGDRPPARADVDKLVLDLGEGLSPEPLPLAAVHQLVDLDAGGPERVAVRGFERVRLLAENLYRPHFLPGMAARGEVLRLAGAIAQHAEVFELRRARDAAGLDALVRWLEHEWSGPSRPAGEP